MKRLQLIICLLISNICLFAQQRSESEAMYVANEFFSKTGKQSCLSVVPYQKVDALFRNEATTSRKKAKKNRNFYVVNDEANERYVIVSADKRHNGILGYSDNGTFDVDNVAEGLLEMLEWYDYKYNNYFSREGTPNDSSIKKSAKKIDFFIRSEWNQKYPYNIKCPEKEGKKCPAGCVAVAMAQVMKYYEYPQTFSWNLMFDKYDENNKPTNEQMNSVAELVYGCGKSVNMLYDTISSTANAYNIAHALINNFGYNPNIAFYKKKYFTDEEWYGIIDTELENRHPVLYGASTSKPDKSYSPGHRFIIDGRDENGLYHVNWGFTQDCNGYYDLNLLQPRGREDEFEGFNIDPSIVCRIDTITRGKHEDVFCGNTFVLEHNGDSLEFSLSYIYSFITRTTIEGKAVDDRYFDTSMGIGFFDSNWNCIDTFYLKSILARCDSFKSKENGKIGSYTSLKGKIPLPKHYKKGNQFYIAPYARVEGETTPTRIRTLYGQTDYYLAEIKDGSIQITLKGKIEDIAPVVNTTPKEDDYMVEVDSVSSNRYWYNKSWKISLRKDNNDKDKYWFDGIAPQLHWLTESVDGGEASLIFNENKVYGYIKDNDVIYIPDSQYIGRQLINSSISGAGCYIKNMSENDSIIVRINKDGSMAIDGLWGIVEHSNLGIDSDDDFSTMISFYDTRFRPVTESKIELSNSLQTFCSVYDLDFTNVEGLEAYIISAFDPETNEAIGLRVNNVPAQQGLLLIGEAGRTYSIPVVKTQWIYSNLLIGVLSDTELTSQYVLDGDSFVAVNGTHIVRAGNAYLSLPNVSASKIKVRLSEPTGIETIKSSYTPDTWYTLQGIPLNSRPTKSGLYIVNGEKVVVR